MGRVGFIRGNRVLPIFLAPSKKIVIQAPFHRFYKLQIYIIMIAWASTMQFELSQSIMLCCYQDTFANHHGSAHAKNVEASINAAFRMKNVAEAERSVLCASMECAELDIAKAMAELLAG